MTIPEAIAAIHHQLERLRGPQLTSINDRTRLGDEAEQFLAELGGFARDVNNHAQHLADIAGRGEPMPVRDVQEIAARERQWAEEIRTNFGQRVEALAQALKTPEVEITSVWQRGGKNHAEALAQIVSLLEAATAEVVASHHRELAERAVEIVRRAFRGVQRGRPPGARTGSRQDKKRSRPPVNEGLLRDVYAKIVELITPFLGTPTARRSLLSALRVEMLRWNPPILGGNVLDVHQSAETMARRLIAQRFAVSDRTVQDWLRGTTST